MKPFDNSSLPFPQTPESALALLRANGVCITDWARNLGLARMAVVDILRGKNRGNRGMAHRAAVALGIKADSITGEEPIMQEKKLVIKGKSIPVTLSLEIRHTECRFGKPLTIVSGLPGDGAELRPAALRAYARMLLEAADDAERIEKNGDAGGSATYSVGVV